MSCKDDTLCSYSPVDGSLCGEYKVSTSEDVNEAVDRAKQAQKGWYYLGIEDRIKVCWEFEQQLHKNSEKLAKAISKEMGKPLWEAKTEVKAAIAKVNHSVNALERTTKKVSDKGEYVSVTDYKPLGTVAVLGPFNFPLHLPNGHIIPALLMGNSVVFKPSDHTPVVGSMMLELWKLAGLPDDVITIVYGKADTGKALCDSGVDGVFFTGSNKVGSSINENLALRGHTGKMLALEMGGNNPLIVWDVELDNFNKAIANVMESAFITSGQRCVCARRLIISNDKKYDYFLDKLVKQTSELTIGHPLDDKHLGTMVSLEAAMKASVSYSALVNRGAEPMLDLSVSEYVNTMVSPGIVNVTDIKRYDEEIFGPLLQVVRVNNLDEAIKEANNTEYGLSAGVLSDCESTWDCCYENLKAGIINWNKPMTGALSENPFGGLGKSGNNRPSAFFASDYCCHPVASLQSKKITMPAFFGYIE
jgi:succinylglutamic semialdehyde dehydrogenase